MTGQQKSLAVNAQDINFNPFLTGGVTIHSDIQVWGYEVNAVAHSIRTAERSFDLLVGFRSLNLHENLSINQTFTSAIDDVLTLQFPLAGQGADSYFFVPKGAPVTAVDSFATRNQFYGGQVGGRFGWDFGRLSADLTAKVALGVTHQEVDINGSSTAALVKFPNAAAIRANLTTPGGMFALQNNIGSYSQNQFTMVPEIGFNLNYAIQVAFSNSGTVEVDSGTIYFSGGFSNFAGSTLAGGNYFVTGTLKFNGASIATNAANITLDGASSQIVDETGANALANLAANPGSFTIQNGRNFTSAGNFDNAGTLTVGAGSVFSVPASSTYTQGASATLNVRAAGTTSVLGSFANFSGGTLAGGTYQIAGAFRFANAAITTNAAAIVLDGASSSITDLAGTDALANLASNASSGTFTIQNGRDYTASVGFSNAGALFVGANSTFTTAGSYSPSGTTDVLFGGQLSLMAGGSSSGDVSVDGTLALAAGTTFTVSGAYAQNGTLYLPATATLNLTGTFSNFSSGTLTGGTYQIGGTLRFNSAAITTNAATIILDGSGSGIVDQSSNDALANFASNFGNFTVQNGRNLNVSGSFANAGAVTIASGSNFTISGNYAQTTASASTTLIGATLTAVLVDLQGGSLAGSGTISGNLRNAGQISLGTATTAGTLNITGSYTQTSGGTLNMKIGGPNPADSDLLLISGAATLDGTLNVTLFNSFTPTSGSSFTPITFASHGATTFATTNLDPAFVNPPTYNPTNVTLVAM